MTATLWVTVAGLALLDSLNPATIAAVTLVLLTADRRPGVLAGATVLGAALTVFASGALLFLTAGAAAGAVEGIVTALRFIAFGAAGIALIVAGLRRLRARPRRRIRLPDWFTIWTALPFGALITAADLPNAFPYFITIERLVAADVPTGLGLAVIAGYAIVYCLPCLVLLAIGLAARARVRAWLERLVARLGTGTVPSSVPVAITLVLLGVAVASVPFWL